MLSGKVYNSDGREDLVSNFIHMVLFVLKVPG